MKKCPICGATYDDDALHCEKDGSPLVSQETISQGEDDSPTIVGGKASSAPVENNDSPATEMAHSAKPKSAKKGGNKALIWTLVVLLVLGALGGGGYYLYSQGMLDDLLGTHNKKEAVDDEDDEEDEGDIDDDEDFDVDDDFDTYDDEFTDEDVSDTEEAAIEEVVIEEPVVEEQPETPAPRQETPTPRQETPTPRQETPTPRQETPTPRQETPTPRQETPAQPVRQETPPATPRTNVTPVTPPQPTVTMVTVTSNIARAMIIVDGVDVGWAPWSGELTPGMHTFALKAKNKEKLRTSDFSVNVAGRSMTVPINVPDPSVFD